MITTQQAQNCIHDIYSNESIGNRFLAVLWGKDTSLEEIEGSTPVMIGIVRIFYLCDCLPKIGLYPGGMHGWYHIT